MSPTISWSGNEEFFEVAAVLGILPNMVMAKYGGPSLLTTVLYTPESDEDDPPVWCAQLWRHDDGVLHVERNADTGRKFSSFVPVEP
jgi:hypothetical protein